MVAVVGAVVAVVEAERGEQLQPVEQEACGCSSPSRRCVSTRVDAGESLSNQLA